MHDKIKSGAALIVAFLLTLAGMLTVATPAQAAQSDCPQTYLCIWNNVDYTGTRCQWTVGYIRTLPGDHLQLPAGCNNMASSIYLRGSLQGTTTLTLWNHDGSTATRGISTDNYSDSNMLTSPGISGFSNVLSGISVNS